MTALLAWALVATGFTVVTVVRLGRRRRPVAAAGHAPVLLLRPADALGPHELAALATPLDGPPAVDHVVVSPERPPLPAGIRWLRSDPACANRKVGHLLHALDALPHDGRAVLAVDADVHADAALIAALAAPLAAGAALVTAAPSPESAPGLAARAVRALLCHTHQSFAALDAVAVGAKPVCGKAIGLGAEAVGVLRELDDHIGEDLELARRLHRRGSAVALAAVPARVAQAPGATVAAALDRFTRWMQVLRAHRPGLYPTVPLLLAPTVPLLAVTLLLRSPALAGAVALLAVARTALASRLSPSGALAWPLGELLLLAAFVRSLSRRGAVWRGRRFVLAAGGRMRPVP